MGDRPGEGWGVGWEGAELFYSMAGESPLGIDRKGMLWYSYIDNK